MQCQPHGLHLPWLAEKKPALEVEAYLEGVIIFRLCYQTQWMSSPSIRRGVYQSLGSWGQVLALNYGACKDRRKSGAGGLVVLLVVAPYGTTSWTLPDRYIF